MRSSNNNLTACDESVYLYPYYKKMLNAQFFNMIFIVFQYDI